MDREILFRGKCTLTGNWLYGSLYQDEGISEIMWQTPLSHITPGIDMSQEVDSETVGQFTGFCKTGILGKGEEGQKIFEGDIFRQTIEHNKGDEVRYLVVTYIQQRAAFYMIPIDNYLAYQTGVDENEDGWEWLFEHSNLYDFSVDVGLAWVGNIHDNPELLYSI